MSKQDVVRRALWMVLERKTSRRSPAKWLRSDLAGISEPGCHYPDSAGCLILEKARNALLRLAIQGEQARP